MRNWETIDWAELFARLHPVLLHLPIGLFVALAWLQCWSRYSRPAPGQPDLRTPLIWLLLISTLLSATSGWLLHEGGGYPEIVEWHEWGGIGLTAVAIGITVTHLRKSPWYPRLVWVGFFLLLPTAHLGGSLTHGEDFLIEPLLKPEDPGPRSLPDGASTREVEPTEPSGTKLVAAPMTFEEIAPVFEQLCSRCHGERKQRGGLALHTLEEILRGGDSGPGMVEGDARGSLLLQRLLLPLDDPDHMPPDNKPQPTQLQLAAIEAWLSGSPAPPGFLSTAGAQPASAPASIPEPSPESARGEDDQAAQDTAIEGLRRGLAHVQPIQVGSPLLWINLAASELRPGDLQSWLAPLADRVFELSLAGRPVTAGDLEFLGTLPVLERLDLRRYPGDALDLGGLATSTSLRVLNLAGSKLAPGSDQILVNMRHLERVYLWDTGIEQSADEIIARRAGLEIIGASALPDEPLEVEPEVVFQEQESAQEEDHEDGDALGLNETCPVTKSPVDPRFTTEHEGRTIAFCCPSCPKTFEADPQKYLSELD